MIEQNEEVVEETTEEQKDQPIEQEVENLIDETKFDSAGDDRQRLQSRLRYSSTT